MDMSGCTTPQVFFFGDSDEYGSQDSFTGGVTPTSSSNLISLQRDGSGEEILRDAPERSTLTVKCQIRNALFEGTTGNFTVTTTASSGGIINTVSGFGKTITPSGFNNRAPVISPTSLVAGDITNLNVTFHSSNPIPSDGKIVLEVPSSFTNVQASGVVSSSMNGGFNVATVANNAAVFDNTMKTSGGSWIVTITRDGVGDPVAEDTVVNLIISSVTNMQFEGPSGQFTYLKTTLNDGTTAIDETSTESDAIGLSAPSVTITPSGFKQEVPLVTPLSLIAGDNTNLNFTFVTQNPIPADGKIYLEVPDTFTNVSASLVTDANVDGSFNVSTSTSFASVFDNTLKTSGGPWVIEIIRNNDGSVVPEDFVVTLVVSSVTNMQFEGPSGDFYHFKTTLSDGTTAIDETSNGPSFQSDAIGLNASSVTITPSGFKAIRPDVYPVSLVAGEQSDLTVTFTTQNPLPIDAIIYVEVPHTFTNVDGSSVSSATNVDGGFTVSQTGPPAVFDNTLKMSGGNWVIEVARDGFGTVTAEDVTVTIVISSVTNMQHEGASGTFPLVKTTLSDGTTAIDESSVEIDAIGLIPNSVTITPQIVHRFSARPDSLIAALDSTFSFSVEIWNPLPINGTLLLTFPNTFPNNMFSQTTAVTSPELTGTWSFQRDSSYRLFIRRNGDGQVVAAGSTLTFQLDKVFNPLSIGDTNDFFFQTFLFGDVVRIDEGYAPSIYVDKQITDVGVEFGSTTVAVKEQMKQWYFHGYGLNPLDEVKWVDNSATIDEDCQTLPSRLSVTSTKMMNSIVAANATRFPLYFHNNSASTGPWKLCYLFYNGTGYPGDGTNPYKLYAGMTVDVREFYHVDRADRGDKHIAVAHRQKTLFLRGHGIATNDQVKWISTDRSCEDGIGGDFVSYRDEEWHEMPSAEPSEAPSVSPTNTHAPSEAPTEAPSAAPSLPPTRAPSGAPSLAPSAAPTNSHAPSEAPSGAPSEAPSGAPSEAPSGAPSEAPSGAPSEAPSGAPSAAPSRAPSVAPSRAPSAAPSSAPSGAPTGAVRRQLDRRFFATDEAAVRYLSVTSAPSGSPSEAPSGAPSGAPSEAPSRAPSAAPSAVPSSTPSFAPSSAPSAAPSISPQPSSSPSASPSAAPSGAPSEAPTEAPSGAPTEAPSGAPSEAPTWAPSTAPSEAPSSAPSSSPSAAPSISPMPSAAPSANYDGYFGSVSVTNNEEINFALSYLAAGDIYSVDTELAVDATNLTMCYKFENEKFQPYPQTHLELKMISQVDSTTGMSDWGVVDVPKTFQFRGYGISGADSAYWVNQANECNQNNPNLRVDLEHNYQNERVNTTDMGNMTVTFKRVNSGEDLDLCYQFGNEWAAKIVNVSLHVTEVHSLIQSQGDVGVTVVDYPKTFKILGDYLSPTDKFRWGIDGDCGNPADIYENNTLFVDSIAAVSPSSSTTETTFTMMPSTSGLNLTFCYKHRDEPWKAYHDYSNDVRMVHDFYVGTGDRNHTVVDQSKLHTFTGHGVNSTDRAKWIKFFNKTHMNEKVLYDTCNNHTLIAATHDNVVDNFIHAIDGQNSAVFNFSETSGGYWVALCYAFDNEPFQLYTQLQTQVHHVRNISSFVGGADMMFVDVGERLGLHGDYITNLDHGRWVRPEAYTDADCENIYSSYTATPWFHNNTWKTNYTFHNEESVTSNASHLPDSHYYYDYYNRTSHEVTFWFNDTYSGRTPIYCHKFKNEPWKVYPNLKIDIAHVSHTTVEQFGQINEGVINMEKSWRFWGGHLREGNRVKWVAHDTPGCGVTAESGYATSTSPPDILGNVSVFTNRTIETLFNFTSEAYAGHKLKLCYQASNEPWKPYDDITLNLHMVRETSVDVGSVDQAVPFFPKIFNFAGQGLSDKDVLKWVDWHADCNAVGNNAAPQAKGNGVLDPLFFSTTDALGRMLEGGVEATYGNAEFIKPAGPLKLCYKFNDEPFMEYYDFPVTVTGVAEVVSVDGDSDVMVLDLEKRFGFLGNGVGEGDVATWVIESANSDDDCETDSIYFTGYSSVVDYTGNATFQVTDRSKVGETWKLCYKFGAEPYKLYNQFTVFVKTIGTMKAVAGSNTTAVALTTKTFEMNGGHIAPGDMGKWIEGGTNDAHCQDEFAGGLLEASVMGADRRISFLFTSPSPEGSFFSLCWKFGNEKYKLYNRMVVEVLELTGMNETLVVADATTYLSFSGIGFNKGDAVKFIEKEMDCNDDFAFGAGSSFGYLNDDMVATLAFSEYTLSSDLILCFKFKQEPFSRYEGITLWSVKPSAIGANATSIVVGRPYFVEVEGTFGISVGDSAFFVANNAKTCDVENVDYAVVAEILMTERGATSHKTGRSVMRLDALMGVNENAALKMCYRFGGAEANYTLLPQVPMTSRVVSSLSVDLLLLTSALNTEVEFTFSGYGIEDGDEVLFVGLGVNSDADCATAAGVGGSSKNSLNSRKSIFTFSSAVEALNLCYKFGGEDYKLYVGLPVIDIGIKEEEEEIFLEAPAEVTLSLSGSVDDIPAGSPARATFENNFVKDISAALGIDSARVSIESIRSGSILVDFEIQVSRNSAEPLVTEIVTELITQLNNPSSAIFSGNVTSTASSEVVVTLLEPVVVEPTSSSSSIKIVTYQQNGYFGFGQSEYLTTEGSGVVKLNVVRGHGAYGGVVLDYFVVDGTAKGGEDFISGSGSVVFEHGDVMKEVVVELLDDAVREPHYETFEVYLRLNEGKTYSMNKNYEAQVNGNSNATVKLYDWGEGGGVLREVSFVDGGGFNGWGVVGNDGLDLFADPTSDTWVDTWGFSAVDVAYGSEEYNDACDYAQPDGACGYSCQYGKRAFANVQTGEPSTVLELDGKGYVVGYRPMGTLMDREDLTIMMWVRGGGSEGQRIDGSPKGALFDYIGDDEEDFHRVLLSGAGEDLSLLINDKVILEEDRYDGSGGGDRRGIKLGINLADDDWHFVAVSWRGSDGRVIAYKDGEKVFDGGPYKVGEVLKSGGGVVLGRRAKRGCLYDHTDSVLSNCEFVENTGFIGHLQNVMLMQGFLDNAKVAQAMKIPTEIGMDTLMMFWRFGIADSEGRIVKDSSGQGLSDWEGGNEGYASEEGSRLVVGTPIMEKGGTQSFPCGEIYKNIWHFDSGWEGDLKGAYGGRLQFKLRANSFHGNERNGRGSVVLIGDDGSSVSYKSKFGGLKGGDWVYYSVVLREDHGWVNEPGGDLCNREKLEGILEGLDKLLIRGDEFVYGEAGMGMEVVSINEVKLFAK